MTTINDTGPQELLGAPNYAVISTVNHDGSIHNTIVWVSAENGHVAVNSALGRLWPTNLQRDPRVTVLVYEAGNPYHFVEIRGTASGTRDGADEHIDALAKKYMGLDAFPGRRAGDERIKFVIEPAHVRHVEQS